MSFEGVKALLLLGNELVAEDVVDISLGATGILTALSDIARVGGFGIRLLGKGDGLDQAESLDPLGGR